MTAEQGK